MVPANNYSSTAKHFMFTVVYTKHDDGPRAVTNPLHPLVYSAHLQTTRLTIVTWAVHSQYSEAGENFLCH